MTVQSMPGPTFHRGAWPFTTRLVLALMAAWGLAASCHGQYAGQRVPTVQYQATVRALHDGDYVRALRSFQSEGRGAIKTAATRWIDSICYHAMIGECHYQMGQLPEALDHFTSAIQLHVAYSDWLTRVQYRPLEPGRPRSQREQVNWGQSKRASQPAHFRDSMPIQMGRLDANEAYRQGGVVTPPKLFGIDAVEIVRATSLAIRRRTELLGPTSRHDALTGQLVAALAARPGLPNHWSECWIDVQLGLAHLAAGQPAQAKTSLQRGLLAAGQFDHPLTGVALFELGRIALAEGNLREAAGYFEEATYSAAYYGDIGVLEEAFRQGAVVHLLANPKTVYAPLPEALAWANRNRYRQLTASLLVSLAENQAVLGNTAAADQTLREASGLFKRRDFAAGRLGAAYSFVGSRVLFQQKNTAAGDAAVARAMDFMRQGSLWLFHVALADRLYVDGVVTARVATDLYATVLRDPQPLDWSLEPMESLAVLVTPHPVPFEHWFEAAVKRKAHEDALEISDRARRHRFLATLPYGGRLDSLRWLLDGPEEFLDAQARLLRRDLLVSLPGYERASKEAAAARGRLAQLPPVAADAPAAAVQGKELADLAAISMLQETLLREVAVSRQPSDLVFPPLRRTADLRKALPDGSAVLAFFATSRGTYAFLVDNARYDYWAVGNMASLSAKLKGFLRDLGLYDANREVAMNALDDAKWKQSGAEVLDLILKDSRADFTSHFDELIVVPDGLFWYVPFESLQVVVDGQSESLISRFRIRYAPTIGLAVPDGRRRKTVGRTGVALGRLFPGDADAVAQAAFDEFARAVPGAAAFSSRLPAPSSLYRVAFDSLVVLGDIQAGKEGVYSWEPIPVESPKKGGNALGDWIRLPLGGPQTVVLPGFHTATESGLKRYDAKMPGREMFLSVCGLMAGGTRTVLLSRWRTGGQVSFDLVREFAQELPHATPAEAWQRAVLLARESRIDPATEPRIGAKGGVEPPKAEHPFFWAGYMLIDPGDAPREAPPGPEMPPPPPPAAEAPAPDPVAPVVPVEP